MLKAARFADVVKHIPHSFVERWEWGRDVGMNWWGVSKASITRLPFEFQSAALEIPDDDNIQQVFVILEATPLDTRQIIFDP